MAMTGGALPYDAAHTPSSWKPQDFYNARRRFRRALQREDQKAARRHLKTMHRSTRAAFYRATDDQYQKIADLIGTADTDYATRFNCGSDGEAA